MTGATEVEFSGFTNLNVTYSSGDTLSFRSSLLNQGRQGVSFAPDSILGLQANIHFNHQFDFVGQIIVQDRTDSNVSNYLEQAFLRYQINRNWSAKIGRLSTNSYLFTDYRYVGHLLNWVRPPVEMYSTAGSLGNMDGAQISYTKEVSFGAVKLAYAYGNSVLHNDQGNGDISFKYDGLSAFNVEFQATDWRLHGAYLSAKLDNFVNPDLNTIEQIEQVVPPVFLPYAQELIFNLVPDGRTVSYASVGGQYNFEQLELIAELSDYDSDWLLAGGSRSGYVTAAYRINNIIPYTTLAFYNGKTEPEVIDYDAAQNQLPALAFSQLLALTRESNEAVRNAAVDQDSISLGLRWEYHPQWSLKFQFDHYRIKPFGSGLFAVNSNQVTPDKDLAYNVISLGLTTTF